MWQCRNLHVHFMLISVRMHYDDVIMGTMASQITSLAIVYSFVYSGADQSKHQSSASLAFVWGIHRGPVNSPHKWPVTRKMFPFDDVNMRHDYFIIQKSRMSGSRSSTAVSLSLILFCVCLKREYWDLTFLTASRYNENVNRFLWSFHINVAIISWSYPNISMQHFNLNL